MDTLRLPHISRLADSIESLRTLVGAIVVNIMKHHDRITYIGCISIGPLMGVGAGVLAENAQIGITSTVIGSIGSLLVWLPSYIDKYLR